MRRSKYAPVRLGFGICVFRPHGRMLAKFRAKLHAKSAGSPFARPQFSAAFGSFQFQGPGRAGKCRTLNPGIQPAGLRGRATAERRASPMRLRPSRPARTALVASTARSRIQGLSDPRDTEQKSLFYG